MLNKKIKFISEKRQPKDGEMIIFSSQYVCGGGISMEAWDSEEPYALITENIPEIPLEENEVILHHDLISTNGFDGRDFLSDFLEYMTTGSRETTFGPYKTKTFVVKLKDDWKSRCVAMEEVWA